MPPQMTPKTAYQNGQERQQSYGPPELTGPFEPEDFPGTPDAPAMPNSPQK